MLYTITPKQMMSLESEVVAGIGLPSILLMEHAAQAVVRAMRRMAPHRAHALFVCGPGNNGADGCAAARLWTQRGGRATVWLPSPPETLRGEAGIQARMLAHCGVAVALCAEDVPLMPEDAEVIVDALFGTGLQRPVEGNAAALVRAINGAGLPVAAVDIPSGIDGETGRACGEAVRAHTTVTFHRPKPGHYFYPGRECAGRLIVADIGIRPAWDDVPGNRVLEASDLPALLPARPHDGHKGTFGHVLVVTGSRGMAGAATLCAEAALRTGAGLVTVACPRSIVPIVQQRVPCAMAVGLPETDGRIDARGAEMLAEAAHSKDALAVGPGLGQGEDLLAALQPLLSRPLPMAIDADALNALAKADALPWLGPNAVLTPHPGEMARLLRIGTDKVTGDPQAAAKALEERTGAAVLLKGATTVITGGGRTTFNCTGCDGMATGGSGDVLTGLVAGLCAQGMGVYDAASAAAWLHGRAGEHAAGWFGHRAMTAIDLLAAIPDALRETER
ncbi:MAG: NAD(P)H-hydrate dehydratase [Clostridia bacterium]|nr:NAD(P)H-hydrate dehydratase [Clostridia bacterium]